MAAESNKLDIETEVKCPPHKFYEMIKYTFHHLPLVFPETSKSSEILEGDGESVGTIRLWKYVLPVKWSVEYGKCSEGISDPHHYLDLFAMINDKVAAHIASKA
ncbi:hypothetical protein FRX31_016232 [Thalictrum thalictroides]|uniref:Bet v I/Major latex protein domain-containing protein n=1 Tax=Thalictrum thalictroides TaxID=46969 RepID=A0A7J6WA51_THATH|nr:hypothetical protein FRX31_016232 [Thalictrum thalictroides]